MAFDFLDMVKEYLLSMERGYWIAHQNITIAQNLSSQSVQEEQSEVMTPPLG